MKRDLIPLFHYFTASWKKKKNLLTNGIAARQTHIYLIHCRVYIAVFCGQTHLRKKKYFIIISVVVRCTRGGKIGRKGMPATGD
jgi:hypothetical protein